MSNLKVIAPAPHFRSGETTSTIMLSVVAALIPAVVVSFLVFGPQALLLEAVCVVASVFFEYLFRVIMCKRDNTIWDCSAIVTGLLLAFNLPVGMPIWMAVLGCAVAIIVTKQLFGGIGQNFANPAIVGRIFLLVSFGGQMTTWAAPRGYFGVDAVSGATPLAILKNPELGLKPLPDMLNMLLGIRGGSVGETCIVALVIGGIFLIWKKVITATTPVVFLLTIVVLSLCFGLNPAYELVAGGAVLGAFFMATDYATSPVTESGKVIFALGCGIITMLIRAFGSYPEGVSFSILLMNIMTPHIDSLTRKKPFGGVVK
ncbi:MAG: RnfABCDGE type electron transport complex subunit D [Angelakisella sp.]|nr:RnfABCDGE type electron transport complex subunit D [Angelakisella sp.]